jgi:hypothetical protein
MERERKRVAIPSDWSGITIGMYQKFELLKNKGLKESEYNLEVLSIICGLEKSIVDRMEVKSVKKIFKTLSFLDGKMPDEKKLIKKVDWNGKKYGFIPNLSEITMGEYIDIEEYCKDAQKSLHKIMSVLYRPIVKETKTRYSIMNYETDGERQDEFLNFPIIPSISALSFFFRLGKILPNALDKYLKKARSKKKQLI